MEKQCLEDLLVKGLHSSRHNTQLVSMYIVNNGPLHNELSIVTIETRFILNVKCMLQYPTLNHDLIKCVQSNKLTPHIKSKRFSIFCYTVQ